MAKTLNGYGDANGNGNAYCTKCNKVVPKTQVKHELGYAMVDKVGHTLVCVCVGCFNQRFVETQPANKHLAEAFINWMIYMCSGSPGAEREYENLAALHGFEVYKGDETNV
jgi:hypothetical protein